MTKLFSNYWGLRELMKSLIPRRSQLESMEKHKGLVREKGRKVNYSEFSFDSEKFEVKQRMLNKEEINSFIEISLRAAHCPLPLNSDVYDALSCSFSCRYCLPPTSKVQMFDGTRKSIGRIKKGDRIISVNINTLELEIAEVIETMRRKANDLIVFQSENKLIKLTPEHPVFTKRGWVHAQD